MKGISTKEVVSDLNYDILEYRSQMFKTLRNSSNELTLDLEAIRKSRNIERLKPLSEISESELLELYFRAQEKIIRSRKSVRVYRITSEEIKSIKRQIEAILSFKNQTERAVSDLKEKFPSIDDIDLSHMYKAIKDADKEIDEFQAKVYEKEAFIESSLGNEDLDQADFEELDGKIDELKYSLLNANLKIMQSEVDLLTLQGKTFEADLIKLKMEGANYYFEYHKHMRNHATLEDFKYNDRREELILEIAEQQGISRGKIVNGEFSDLPPESLLKLKKIEGAANFAPDFLSYTRHNRSRLIKFRLSQGLNQEQESEEDSSIDGYICGDLRHRIFREQIYSLLVSDLSSSLMKHVIFEKAKSISPQRF